MTNALDVSKSFEQRMFERIREQMGDLLSEADLRKILEKAVGKAFFEDRIIESSYGRSTVKPSLFVEVVQTELREKMTAVTRQWVADNQDLMLKELERLVGLGMLQIVSEVFNRPLNNVLTSMREQLQQKGIPVF